MLYKILLLVACSWFTIMAETHIAGDIHKMTFDGTGNPYIVEQDIIIPAQQEVTFKSGCIFLFKPFAGLSILGKLNAAGTDANPIVFTSINDGEYNPASKQLANPFDWNGLLVGRESTGANFKNIFLRYSVYGIKSQNPNITIQNGKFRSNGQFHFTINDKIQMVQDDLPYTYGISENNSDATVTRTTRNDPSPAKAENAAANGKKISKEKRIIRYSCLGVGIAGTVGLGIFGVQTIQNYQTMQNDLKAYESAPTLKKPTLKKVYDDSKESYTQSQVPTIICGALAILGFTGFTLTFVF